MKHVNSYQMEGYTVIELNHNDHDYNVIDQAVAEEFCALMDATLDDTNCSGVILTSANNTFCSGADIQLLSQINRYQSEVSDIIEKIHQTTMKMESSSIPIVAALTGTAVGGGLELALACQYRIAIDEPTSRYGLPEIKLGIFPGFGGSQRLPRLIGVQKSLELMLKGSTVPSVKAKALGIIDELTTRDQLLSQAVNYLNTSPTGKSRWLQSDFQMKDMPHSYSGMMTWSAAITLARSQTKGHYPAVKALLSAVYEGIGLGMEQALLVEHQYFMMVVNSPIPENLIRIYLSQKALVKCKPVVKTFKKISIIGSGLMGSGIASVACLAGFKVHVVDTSMEKAKQSEGYLKRLLDAGLKRKRYTESIVSDCLSRLSVSDQIDTIRGSDLVIEAVFESREVKEKIYRQIEPLIDSEAIIASNTSSIPISELAKGVTNPKRFVGLHFFSPVEKMALVEVIKGKQTTDSVIASARYFSQKISKVPITVNDGCGFYTTRVFARYPQEALICLKEGIHPAVIEQAGRVAGMPMGPLEISDAVGIDVMSHIMSIAKDYDIYHDMDISSSVIDHMVSQSRLGKKSKKGFYDYQSNGHSLWSGSYEWVQTDRQISLVDLGQRLMYGQLIEMIKCWDESILRSDVDADIGAVLGWGFAPYVGGPAALIKTIGWEGFLKDSAYLADTYGERFRLPADINKPDFL